MHLNQQSQKAFTLVELLVVIAIIALLISILLPSLGKAKENARRSACLANLQQLGQAFQQYLHENGDLLPAASQMPSLDAETADPNDRYPAITIYLKPYSRVAEVFRCPADVPGKTVRERDDPNIAGRSYWETEGTSYEYNRLPGMLMDISTVTGQAGKVNVGDSVVKITPSPPGRLQDWMNKTSDLFLLTEYDPFHGKRGSKEIRHTLYADFHVEESRHFPFNVDPNDPWAKDANSH